MAEFGKLNFAVSFNPQTAFPLDARSYFESYEAAAAAAAKADVAGSSTTTYYYGQQVVVVENNTATLYVIQPDKTLGELGGKVAINPNAFAYNAQGALDLYGFADAVAGAQLLKGADGKLSWVKPDATTVEGLETAVSGLQDDVGKLSTAIGDKTAGTGLAGDVAQLEESVEAIEKEIGNPKDGETPASGLYAELEKKANAADVYTKEDADKAIADAVAAADHLGYVIIESTDKIDLTAEDADHYIYLVGTEAPYDEYMVINGELEKVGNWSVDLSDYATITYVNTELGKKVNAEEGYSLISAELLAKLENIEAEAEVNFIKSVETVDFTVEETGKLLLNNLAISKVTGLQDALNAKVDADATARLMKISEGTKLEGIEEGAQVNFVKTVDTTELNVDEEGKLSLIAVDSAKVSGLSTALASKVDKTTYETKVGSLEQLISSLNSSVEDLQELTGTLETDLSTAEEDIINLKAIVSKLGDNYVTTNKFNSVIGNMTKLSDNTTIVDEIVALQEAMKWHDIQA